LMPPKMQERQMLLLGKIWQNRLASGRRRKLKLTALRLEHKTFPAPTCTFQRHVGADMSRRMEVGWRRTQRPHYKGLRPLNAFWHMIHLWSVGETFPADAYIYIHSPVLTYLHNLRGNGEATSQSHSWSSSRLPSVVYRNGSLTDNRFPVAFS